MKKISLIATKTEKLKGKVDELLENEERRRKLMYCFGRKFPDINRKTTIVPPKIKQSDDFFTFLRKCVYRSQSRRQTREICFELRVGEVFSRNIIDNNIPLSLFSTLSNKKVTGCMRRNKVWIVHFGFLQKPPKIDRGDTCHECAVQKIFPSFLLVFRRFWRKSLDIHRERKIHIDFTIVIGLSSCVVGLRKTIFLLKIYASYWVTWNVMALSLVYETG